MSHAKLTERDLDECINWHPSACLAELPTPTAPVSVTRGPSLPRRLFFRAMRSWLLLRIRVHLFDVRVWELSLATAHVLHAPNCLGDAYTDALLARITKAEASITTALLRLRDFERC